MEHTNDIAIKVLSEEFADYKKNSWHYDREYKMIVKSLNEFVNQNKINELKAS